MGSLVADSLPVRTRCAKTCGSSTFFVKVSSRGVMPSSAQKVSSLSQAVVTPLARPAETPALTVAYAVPKSRQKQPAVSVFRIDSQDSVGGGGRGQGLVVSR